MCSLYIIVVFYCYLILYVQLPVLWEYNRKSMINLVASVVKVLCIQTPPVILWHNVCQHRSHTFIELNHIQVTSTFQTGVHGRVFSKDGHPLPASVMIKGINSMVILSRIYFYTFSTVKFSSLKSMLCSHLMLLSIFAYL